MKSALWLPNGYGAVCGRLIAPDQLQYQIPARGAGSVGHQIPARESVSVGSQIPVRGDVSNQIPAKVSVEHQIPARGFVGSQIPAKVSVGSQIPTGDGKKRLVTAKLTGGVTDTQMYDVVVLGKRISDEEIEVQKIESLYSIGGAVIYTGIDSDNKKYFVASIPQGVVKEVKKKIAQNGNPYHCLSFSAGRNSIAYMTIFGDYRVPSGVFPYVLVMNSALNRQDKTIIDQNGKEQKMTYLSCTCQQLEN